MSAVVDFCAELVAGACALLVLLCIFPPLLGFLLRADGLLRQLHHTTESAMATAAALFETYWRGMADLDAKLVGAAVLGAPWGAAHASGCVVLLGVFCAAIAMKEYRAALEVVAMAGALLAFGFLPSVALHAWVLLFVLERVHDACARHIKEAVLLPPLQRMRQLREGLSHDCIIVDFAEPEVRDVVCTACGRVGRAHKSTFVTVILVPRTENASVHNFDFHKVCYDLLAEIGSRGFEPEEVEDGEEAKEQ